MQRILSLTTITALLLAMGGCTKEADTDPQGKTPPQNNTTMTAKTPKKIDWQAKADALLGAYFKQFSLLEKAETTTFWEASITGKKEAYKRNGQKKLALKKFHSDAAKFKEIELLLSHKKELSAVTYRALQVARTAFLENQLPEDLLKTMVQKQKEIEITFQNFRGKMNKKAMTNNELLAALKGSRRSKTRKAAWEGLKEVGQAVGPKIVELAKIRNMAAKKLGFKNYWYMRVKLQDHNPKTLLALFEELDTLTKKPFTEVKAKMDKELARKFRVKSTKLMPWHYDNPFFQAPPPSKALNMDIFFKKMKKEDIVDLGKRFFKDLGLPMEDIAARSDYFEKKGKDQNAFCIDMDRNGDVRTLLNIKPTAKWMDTMLHEAGHAVYDKWISRKLPYNLRQAAAIFTTEGVAMLFGALVKTPSWLTKYAGAKPAKVKKLASAIAYQRKKEQLIFTRWTLVMLNFEKALYDNPDQDLNTLWWDMVEKYQQLKRPKGRKSADWAAKPHFTIAPVYYHNYMMGELFAAQMRSAIAKLIGHKGPTSTMNYFGNKTVGKWFIEKIFAVGMKLQWEKMVEHSTGAPLSAKAFASEIQ